MQFKKYVSCNTNSIELAVKARLRPMQSFFDYAHGGMPYFGNAMSGSGFGNSHH